MMVFYPRQMDELGLRGSRDFTILKIIFSIIFSITQGCSHDNACIYDNRVSQLAPRPWLEDIIDFKVNLYA